MKRECESCPDHQSDSHPNAGDARCECGRWLVPIGMAGILGPYLVCPKEQELTQGFMLL